MTSLTRPLLAAACAVALLAGCSTAPAPQDLCPAYDDLKAATQQLAVASAPTDDIERLKAEADALRTQADAVKDLLDRIQMVSDGRLDQTIGVARQELDEIRASLVTARYQAAETLGPVLAEARVDIGTTVAPVKNLLDAQCANG